MTPKTIDSVIVSVARTETILAHAHVRGILTETINSIGSIESDGNNSFFTETIQRRGLDLIVSVVSTVLELGDHPRGWKTFTFEVTA